MALDLRRRHNRRFVADIVVVALTLVATGVLAAEAPVTPAQSFSSGHPAEGAAQESVKPEVSGQAVSKQRDAISQALGSGFYIFDAQVSLYYDDDGDGHFYGLDVSFDADTDFFAADVYARLYLSYENGPWESYYTTDIFTVFGASGLDDYVVETELFNGYPTGYYDVLIELYDSFDNFVASFGPLDTPELALLPLEDQQKDAPVFETVTVSASRGGGGATGIPALLILGLLAGWRARRLVTAKERVS